MRHILRLLLGLNLFLFNCNIYNTEKCLEYIVIQVYGPDRVIGDIALEE
jgi:hypothetical protein